MAKIEIYYTIDVLSPGYPVYWIDAYGKEHKEVMPTHDSPADSSQEFVAAHPSAVCLKWDAYCKRVERAEANRAKIVAWNEWVVQK